MNTMHRLTQIMALSFLLSVSFSSQAVLLLDVPDEIFSASGDSQGEVTSTFDSPDQDIEIFKEFGAVEELQMDALLSGGQTGSINFSEEVYNGTGLAWTDYHVEIGVAAPTGGDIGKDFEMSFAGMPFSIDWTSEISPSGHSLWLTFTPGSEIADGDSLFLDFTVDIITNTYDNDYAFYMVQMPSITTTNPPTGVPEPGSLALLGLGLAGFGALRRRMA